MGALIKSVGAFLRTPHSMNVIHLPTSRENKAINLALTDRRVHNIIFPSAKIDGHVQLAVSPLLITFWCIFTFSISNHAHTLPMYQELSVDQQADSIYELCLHAESQLVIMAEPLRQHISLVIVQQSSNSCKLNSAYFS